MIIKSFSIDYEIQELVDIAKASEIQPVSLTIAGGITTKSDICPRLPEELT